MKKLLILMMAVGLVTACINKDNLVIPGQYQEQSQGGQSQGTPEDTSPEASGVETEEESESEDNIDNTSFDGTVTIAFNGGEAAVSGSVDGVSIECDGADVVAVNSGDEKVKYILTGTSGDGSFKLYSSKKQAIVLKDLNLTSGSGAAINNQSKKRTFVLIEGTNVIKDCSVNSDGDYPGQTSDEDMKAAFFSEGQLAFSGSGTLAVEAVGKAGITSDDYIHFMTGSDVTVTSSKGHGVRGKDAIFVSGGKVKITLASTATGRKCCSTDSLFFMNGGEVTLVNGASAGMVDSELTGAAGIKADQLFVIRGGTLGISVTGTGSKCISGDGNGFFEGGTVTASAGGSNYGSSGRGYSDSDNSVSSKAIKFDGNLEFSGSVVTAVSKSHEAIESKGTIFISAGVVRATSSDDAVNSSSTMTISDGIVYAFSTGNDGLDANGNLIIKGGTVVAIGCGSPEVAIDANTESGYKFYLQGGNVVAIGGFESNSSVSQAVISTSWQKNTLYTLCDGDGVLFSFKTPSSGGNGLYISAPSLVNGSSYTIMTGTGLSGEKSYLDGIVSLGGSASGGSSSTVTASTYSGGGGMGGGGGIGGGGGMGPGGGGGGWHW